MKNVRRAVDAVDSAAILVGEVGLFVLMTIIFVSVLGRSFFGFSIPDRTIFTEILMVVIVFLALGHVQKLGGHLAVTILSDRLPARVNQVLGSFALVLGIAIFGGAAWFSAEVAIDAYRSDAIFFSSLLDIKRWPALALVPAGLIWWALRMLLQLVTPSERPEQQSER